MDWLKRVRGNSSETCNNRLASLRAFLKYLGSRETSMRYLSVETGNIPRMKSTRKKVHGLTKEAMQALLQFLTQPQLMDDEILHYLLSFMVLRHE